MIDGYFELNIDATKVRRTGTTIELDGDADGVAGGEFVFGDNESDDFFAMYGDFNGDGGVGIIDLLRFRSAWQTNEGDEGFDPIVDFESNGGVGITDLLKFRQRFGNSVSFE